MKTKELLYETSFAVAYVMPCLMSKTCADWLTLSQGRTIVCNEVLLVYFHAIVTVTNS